MVLVSQWHQGLSQLYSLAHMSHTHLKQAEFNSVD